MLSKGRMHSVGERAVGKRPVSVAGPKSEEEVLRGSPVGCWSWWWVGEIWCLTESARLSGKVVPHGGSKTNSCGEGYPSRSEAKT